MSSDSIYLAFGLKSMYPSITMSDYPIAATLALLLLGYLALFAFRSHVVLIFDKTKKSLILIRDETLTAMRGHGYTDAQYDLERKVFDESWIPFLEQVKQDYLKSSPFSVLKGHTAIKRCKTFIKCARYTLDKKILPNRQLNLGPLNEASA